MEVIKARLVSAFSGIKTLFVKKSEFSNKREINFGRIKLMAFMGGIIFIIVVLFLPDDPNLEFSSKIESAEGNKEMKNADTGGKRDVSAEALWSSKPLKLPSKTSVNHNTSMRLTQKGA